MIKILHRINTINKLKNIDKKYGVEIDLRSFQKNLILHHDPFRKGEYFKKWIKYYKHALLIINIKEEGLEESILKILKENKIKNYFFLDQSFPFLIKYSKMLNYNSAFRLSDLESIHTIKKIKKKIKWVWIDFFKNFNLKQSDIKFLNKNKIKICLVSPELKKSSHKNIKNLKKIINSKKLKIDAVCTKKPYLW